MASTKPEQKGDHYMKARNQIIGLGIAMAALAASPKTSAQVNPGPNNSISGTHSSIAGGNWSSISGSNSVIAGGLSNSITASQAAIGGGWGNSVSTVFGTVAGGNANRALGQGSFVGGGQFNDASGFRATVGGGSGNEATFSQSTIGGGLSNTSSGSQSTVGGGSVNTAGATAATVPGGSGANASHYGQFAYASGSFATAGDAQASMYVLRATTSNATQTEMFLDGSAARMTVASGRTLVFEIQVVGRSSGNTSAAYLIRGAIDNNGGTTSFINAIVETLGEDVGSWDATVEADNTNDALVLKVTGAASTTIRWVATVRTTEVAH
jgi:hypothetical protein